MMNLAASVRDRLLNLSRESGEALNVLIDQFAMGRILYRLTQSEYKDKFVLKGAQLFRIWGAEDHRPTRDLDLLGFGDPTPESIGKIFTQLVEMPIDPEDGIEWGDVDAAPIRDSQHYGGVRVILKANLSGARITLQIDVGFGDAIIPDAIEGEWKELLDFPSARLLIYPPETVVAEKLQATVSLGLANSRMKDFFDLFWLCRSQNFEGDLLIQAVHTTFERRRTRIPTERPIALTKTFPTDSSKVVQWNAFLRKGKWKSPELSEVIAKITDFLWPVLSGEVQGKVWNPEKGWATKPS